MQKALDEVIGARNNRVAELREIIEGNEVPTFGKKLMRVLLSHN